MKDFSKQSNVPHGPCLVLCLTIKVEEVIVLVDVCSSIYWRSRWAHVVLHPGGALLLVPRLASVTTDI